LVRALNINGISGWRLPVTLQPDSTCSGQLPGWSGDYNCTGSEIGHLFYDELGGLSGHSIATMHNNAYSLFINLQTNNDGYGYWSSTEYSPAAGGPGADGVWVFRTYIGSQDVSDRSAYLYAMAVHDGDISTISIPAPATVWLVVCGLTVWSGMRFARERIVRPYCAWRGRLRRACALKFECDATS
jgi:hypothetical protein